MTDTPHGRVEGLRGLRYGEVILVRHDGGTFQADVWNTMGLNDCPPTEFGALDPDEIALANGALLAMKNGPRHWVLDAIEGAGRSTAATNKFGTLEMWHAATIDFGAEPPVPGGYVERRVARETVFEWSAGAALHELYGAGRPRLRHAGLVARRRRQPVPRLAGWPRGATQGTATGLVVRHPPPGRSIAAPERRGGRGDRRAGQAANTYQRVDRTD